MIKLTGLMLMSLLVALPGRAAHFESPDILVDSKLDYNWSGLLINKLRLLMSNHGVQDPFKARFNETIIITEANLGEYLPSDALPLINDLGNVIGLRLTNAQTKVEMQGFNYEVKDFRTNLKSAQELSDGLVIATDFSASEISLNADKLSFSLVIPNANGKGTSPIIQIDIIKPRIQGREDRLINLFTKIKIQDQKDFYQLQLQNANFHEMATSLLKYPDDIELDYERIIIPEVEIKIGSKSIEFSSEKIEKLLRKKHSAIKGILLAQAANVLKTQTAKSTTSVFGKIKLGKEYWLSSDLIKSQMEISRFKNTMGENHIEVQIPGDFCTTKNFERLKEKCLDNKVTKTSETRLNQKLHLASMATMKNLMDRGDANLVASISEDYLNKLLVTTYDAGLWKSALDEAGVELGPNRVTMRMDRKGDSGTLLMDVIYRPSRLESFTLGAKEIRFPLVLDISLRIEKHDDEPVAIVRLNDVDLSDETLIKGKPEFNIVSSVGSIPRFKGKVVDTIRAKLSSLTNKDIIELRYPEFRDLGLEKVDFLSDGNGRMNAMLSLEDLME